MNRRNLQLLLAAAGMTTSLAATAQAPFNVISGTAWKESGNVNDLKDAGETGVAGIMVTLLDANSGSTVANAITDNSGAYALNNFQGVGDYVIQFDYPVAGYNLVQKRVGSNNAVSSSADPSSAQTDPFTVSSSAALTNYNLGVSARTNTITYAAIKLSTLTDWNNNFVVPKSDSAIGVLTKATVYVNNTEWHPYFGVENTSGTGVSTSPSSGIQVSITPPIGAAINVSNTIPHINTALAMYDGTTDYGGASGKTWSNEFASVVATPRVITLASQLNTFRGSGTVTFPATALGTVTLAGGGNLLSQISTQIGASVSVVYEYAGGILPVTLTTFNARIEGSDVALSWTTESELNNNHFEVERSIDGKTFTAVGYVNTLAKDGNSNSQLQYTFTDRSVTSGKTYYRLNQVDNDGKNVYSGIRSVQRGIANGVSVYPNPASTVVTINTAEQSYVQVFTLAGQLVAAFNKNAGSQAIDVSQYPAGAYIIFISTGKSQLSEQFRIVH